jgi:hypothetical protein
MLKNCNSFINFSDEELFNNQPNLKPSQISLEDKVEISNKIKELSKEKLVDVRSCSFFLVY